MCHSSVHYGRKKKLVLEEEKSQFCCFLPPYQARCPRQELCLLSLEGCPQTKYTHVADNTHAPGTSVLVTMRSTLYITDLYKAQFLTYPAILEVFAIRKHTGKCVSAFKVFNMPLLLDDNCWRSCGAMVTNAMPICSGCSQ